MEKPDKCNLELGQAAADADQLRVQLQNAVIRSFLAGDDRFVLQKCSADPCGHSVRFWWHQLCPLQNGTHSTKLVSNEKLKFPAKKALYCNRTSTKLTPLDSPGSQLSNALFRFFLALLDEKTFCWGASYSWLELAECGPPGPNR